MSEEHYGQIEQLSAELERLREENRRLREELRAVQANSGNHADAAAPQKPAIATVNKDSSVEEKIALFRSLFGGREDVYAVRWESGKTGKAGYSPGRVRGSGKPTADAKDELLPLDDRVVFDHLAGRKTVGVYPLLKDETCWFLAVDFDKAGIALPLQAGPRRRGNTLFLDHDLQPYPDQWAFLSGVKKIPVGQVEAIVAEAQKAGKVLGVRLSLDEEDTVSPHTPWIKVPPRQENLQIDSLPAEVKITLSNLVYIEKEGLPTTFLNRLIRLAAFQNPDFYRAQAMRLTTFGKPRIIGCAEEFPQHVALPRGCLQDVRELFQSLA